MLLLVTLLLVGSWIAAERYAAPGVRRTLGVMMALCLLAAAHDGDVSEPIVSSHALVLGTQILVETSLLEARAGRVDAVLREWSRVRARLRLSDEPLWCAKVCLRACDDMRSK